MLNHLIQETFLTYLRKQIERLLVTLRLSRTTTLYVWIPACCKMLRVMYYLHLDPIVIL
jgi:hypothetical protein